MPTNFPTSLDNFTNPVSTDELSSVTVPHATQHADLNDAVEALQGRVGITGSGVPSSHAYKIDQLEANAIAKQIVDARGDLITGTAADTVARLPAGSNNQFLIAASGVSNGMQWTNTLTSPILVSAEERWSVVNGTAITGTRTIDVLANTAWLYTTSASGDWTMNFRGDSSNTLNSILGVQESITVVFAVTQGATAYYPTAFSIDGTSVTPLWQGGTAPTAGNASSTDVYTFTIVKRTVTPDYTVFASQVQYKS